jgi:ribosome recycling factor
MLCAVLKSKTAIEISIKIIDTFVNMRKFISSNANIFSRFERIEQRLSVHDNKFNQIFTAIEEKGTPQKQHIFYDGQIFDAYLFVSDIIKSATKSIKLIDNYIDETVLTLFSKNQNIKVTIYTQSISKQLKLDLEKCFDSLKEDLAQIRTGRATPEVVEEILVNAYETQAPVKNYASITIMDAKTISIQPWDKSLVEAISKGVSDANLGFSPIIEGERVLVKLPDLTEERRNDFVKIMGERVEDARIAVRSVRQKFMKEIDEAEKSGTSEDESDRKRDEGEKLVKEVNKRIEEQKENKEKDLMTI